MKRVILSTTRVGLKGALVQGLRNEGCKSIKFLDFENTYCRLSLILPGQAYPTTITVWFNSTDVPSGKTVKRRRSISSWDSSWQVNSSGDVFDSNGEQIGHVKLVELYDTYDKPLHHQDYDLNSIRTDSGDVIIDHPERASTYKDVVNSLLQRTITHRS